MQVKMHRMSFFRERGGELFMTLSCPAGAVGATLLDSQCTEREGEERDIKEVHQADMLACMAELSGIYAARLRVSGR